MNIKSAAAGLWDLLGRHPVFLPDTVPLTHLPMPYNRCLERLNEVAQHYHVRGQGARAFLDAEFRGFESNIDRLDSKEKSKLFSVLSILLHCYRWDRVPVASSEYARAVVSFPPALWNMFCELADEFEHPYCGSLWTTTLSNWYLGPSGPQPGHRYDPSKVQFRDLRVAHNWLCDQASQLEQWVRIFVMTEMVAEQANLACRDAWVAVTCGCRRKLRDAFVSLERGIQQIASVLNHEVRSSKLDPTVWRDSVQPTFVWGLRSGSEPAELLEGASGLQVVCIQLIDLTLGTPTASAMGRAALASRRYLPKFIRVVLSALEDVRSSVRDFVLASGDADLVARYNECVHALIRYRQSHLQRGVLYLRGDGSRKPLTTTALSVQQSEDAERAFYVDMSERIDEVREALKGSGPAGVA